MTGGTSLLHASPVSSLHKSKAGRYRPDRVADGPTPAHSRFLNNASWVSSIFECCLYLLNIIA